MATILRRYGINTGTETLQLSLLITACDENRAIKRLLLIWTGTDKMLLVNFEYPVLLRSMTAMVYNDES